MPDVENVVIIGSGPAGWTAAIYAARAELHPLVFVGVPKTTPSIVLPGGQLILQKGKANVLSVQRILCCLLARQSTWTVPRCMKRSRLSFCFSFMELNLSLANY